MSDNRKYYYLKLKENYFDDDSIVLLESMQDGVLYSNILLKLYLKSLKHGGRLQLDEDIPYTAQMIATITRRQIGVGGILGAFAHEAGDLDGPLGTHPLAKLEAILGGIGIEDDLGDAGAVTQVDEDQPAVIATTCDPATQGDLLADVTAAEFAAGARVHGILVCKILRHCMPSFIMRPAIDSGRPRPSYSQGSYYETSDKPARGAFRQAHLEQARHILGNGVE